MRSDAERWDERYRDRRPGPPTPPAGLVELVGVEPPAAGRCLDVACGLGEQSAWAAGLGWQVLALDASEVAVAAARRYARELGLAERVEVRVHDLDAGLPRALDGTCGLVICQRYRSPALYPQLVRAAAPGGLIVVTVLSQVGLAGAAGPFHAPPGELVDAFGSTDVVIVGDREARGEATLIARRR